MCMYCERRTDIKFGWEQPKLPYHSNNLNKGRLNGNVLENEKWDGVIHDYQTATPELILTCPGYFNGEGVGAIYIPIKYCPECGRKLGKECIMKKKFWEYILENFTIDNNGRKIIYNIIDWVWMQSMDKEDSVNTLDFLLDGIGIKKEEIEQFIDWN